MHTTHLLPNKIAPKRNEVVLHHINRTREREEKKGDSVTALWSPHTLCIKFAEPWFIWAAWKLSCRQGPPVHRPPRSTKSRPLETHSTDLMQSSESDIISWPGRPKTKGLRPACKQPSGGSVQLTKKKTLWSPIRHQIFSVSRWNSISWGVARVILQKREM